MRGRSVPPAYTKGRPTPNIVTTISSILVGCRYPQRQMRLFLFKHMALHVCQHKIDSCRQKVVNTVVLPALSLALLTPQCAEMCVPSCSTDSRAFGCGARQASRVEHVSIWAETNDHNRLQRSPIGGTSERATDRRHQRVPGST